MSTIAEQAAEVSAASATHLPAELARVFSDEQRGWRDRGEPVGVVAVGDKLADFTLPDANGRPVSLGELVADGPAVIVFYRGGWCPYCNLALRAYQAELLPQLDRFGARLVAISPQGPEKSLRTKEKAELAFTVLSDAGAADSTQSRDRVRARGRCPCRAARARTRPEEVQRLGLHRPADAYGPDRRPGTHGALRRHPCRLHRPHGGR